MKKQTQKRMHKVRTPYNFEEPKGQRFTMLSLTQPDQAIPLQVLLERHTRGLPIDVAERIPLYEDEESQGFNSKTFDLVDFENLKKQTSDEIAFYKSELEKEKAEAKRKTDEAKAEKAKSKTEKHTEA